MASLSKRMMRHPLKSGLGLIGVLAFLGLVVLFSDTGQGFLQGDPVPRLETADAVVVLAGRLPEDRLRLERGMQLVRQDTARFLILPMRDPGLDWPKLLRLHDLPYEIPPQQVIIGRPEEGRMRMVAYCGGTFAEAVKTVQIMHAQALRSAVIVSSDYHMRRVRLAFSEADPEGTLAFSYLPVDTRSATGLLARLRSRAALCVEYSKLIAAYCMYPAGRRLILSERNAAAA